MMRNALLLPCWWKSNNVCSSESILLRHIAKHLLRLEVRTYRKRMASLEYVTVNMEQGALRGKVVSAKYGEKFCSFQGIPFAKPPVGHLRFQPPQPPDCWSGIRDALQEGSVAPHVDWIRKEFRGDEDCLFINVFTPKLPSKNNKPLKPVMVWIHGGGFGIGSGNTDLYGPDYLIQADVIMVTFNYRLGALGFLSLEDEIIPGNNGLKDQVAALCWVQKNIMYFGGDPNNVTIFGESAGGASVQYHMLSPMSKGLFHKAIAQSGSVMNPWASTSALRKRSFELGSVLGCKTEDPKVLLNFLRSCSPKQIVEATVKIVTDSDRRRSNTMPFLPIPEISESCQEVFLPSDPKELLKAGKFCDVPFLTGVTSHEGILEIREILRNPSLLKAMNEDFERFVPDTLENEEKSDKIKELSKMIQIFYFRGSELSTNNLNDLVNLQTDIQLAHGVHCSVQTFVKNCKSPLYYYCFCFDSILGIFKRLFGASHLPGASHIDDIGYLFHMSVVDITVDYDSPEMKTIRRMVKMWTNFAKTGNPTPELDSDLIVKWPVFTIDNRYYLKIDHELSVEKCLHNERMQFWDQLHQNIEGQVTSKL